MMINREMKITGAYHEFLRAWGVGAYEARTIDFLRKGQLFHVHFDTGLSEDDKRKGLREVILDVKLPIVEAWSLFSEINKSNYGAKEVCLRAHKRLIPDLKELGITIEVSDRGYATQGRASMEDMQRLAESGFALLGKRDSSDAESYIWIGETAVAEHSPLTIRIGEGRLRNTMQAPLGTFMEKLGNIEESIEKWESVYHSEKTE